ncbi:BLVR domain-containing protein [Caenorhabditis elegans]|uniref:BLVR domain-containing protein n=1 Tax=Caenorhabditis elegans TaxID=6239 RepID=Q20857_CAEEL|nr:BLVR domain-containing protein [Caenorhabditis elegans]CAA90611.2 BLVR domain-containing protein [Caenorhabditis elegans]|eukprot:NP_509998.2 Uncharacterized protein CELE_F55G7.3 [Caenorhabditis elegans]
MDPEFLDSQSDESSDDSYDPSYNPKLGSGFLSVTKISEKMRKSQLKERRLRKQSKVSKCAKKLKRKVPTRQIVTNKPENLYKEHRQGPNTRSNELSNQESLPIVGTYSQNMSETTVEPLFQASKDLHIDASDAMDTNEDMSTFASEEINVTLGSDEEKKQNSTGRGDTDSGTSNANIIGIDFEKEGHQNSNSASVAKPIHKVIFSPAIMPPEHPTSVVIPQNKYYRIIRISC